ncbi:Mov34/MPN/PAD-1 family protein [Nitrosomonas marina]|uniref:Proteasome lid subunit RPN8/RPN11, contains Jab1/MPN metalloenzyme (JAMM) motif n=1 Tax=Nitrosomonas marina TaxID=917 RepID=A0A1H8AGA2_9PROT|nr:M67 family metallopeptidase [Nitrosomonas marina]SEM69740.1 Proteasome lid subunit RPN8/RPN11, contains Jab1/MPN metalloenzyme (JAMM) motif [Nitrosomonas marina]
MLTIHTKLVEAMLAQANKDHPIESCGVIAGALGSNLPQRLIPMENAAHSEDFFQFDPQQQLQVWKEMELRGEEPIVIYHSHTSTQAYPSRTDIEYAAEPGAHYVIISTALLSGESVRSFRIVDDIVIEERIKIVKTYEPDLKQLKVA